MLFFLPFGLAQEPTYIHYEPEIDIPFSTTYGEIIQDSLGYIWFGTDSGLYRYDGDIFEKIPMSSKIRDNEVFDLKKDHNGTLWFLSLTGDLCYLANTEDSVRVFNPGHLMDTCVVIKFQLQKDRIFFQVKSPNETYTLRSFSHHLDPISELKIEYSAGGLFKFAFDNQGQLLVSYWFHSNGLMEFLALDTNSSLDSFSLKFRTNANIKFIHDTEDIYMLSNCLKGGKIFIKNKNHYSPKRLFDSPTTINNWYTKNNNLWMLTDRGCYLYDKTKHETTLIHLKGHDIFSMLIDREGGSWFGSNGRGVLYIPPNTLYNYQKKNLSEQEVQKIQKIPNGPYVISSQNRILFLDPNTLSPLSEEIILNTKIFDAYVQGTRIFIATVTSYSEYNFNKETNKASLVRKVKATIKKSIPLNDGSFLAGGSAFLKYFTEFTPPKNILAERVTALYKDTSSSIVWIGGLQKAFSLRYTSKEEVLTSVKPFNDINDYVTMIIPDKNNCVWFSTTSSGLIKYNKGNKKTKKYPFNLKGKPRKIDQLSCNNPNRVWLSSFNNLFYFDIDKEYFYKQPNIKSIIQAPIISLWDTSDTLLIGTKKGLFIYFANQTNTQLHPLINLESVQINFNDTLIQPSYDLSYTQNKIELKFNTIGSFNPLNKAKVYYKINDSDKWHLAPNKNIILTNLAPAAYQIIVKSVYQEDQLEYNSSIIHLKIHKPFWKTIWFNLLAIFSSTLLVFFWFQRKKQQIEIEKNREQESEKLKNSVLQLQMNPHFIFNSMNTIIYYITVANKEKSIQILTKLSRLIRQIFVFSNKKLIPLSTEIQFLSDYLDMEEERFAKKVKIITTIEQGITESNFPIPPLMVQPIIENSFKHGLFHKKGNGTLQFTILLIKDGVRFIIEDDGVGRNFRHKSTTPNKKISSYDVINNRITLINQSTEEFADIFVQFNVLDLTDDLGNPIGTRSTINFEKKKT